MITTQQAFLNFREAADDVQVQNEAIKQSMENDKILGPMLEELAILRDTVKAEKKNWQGKNAAQLKRLAELRQEKTGAKTLFDMTWEQAIRNQEDVPPMTDKDGNEYAVQTSTKIKREKDVKKTEEPTDDADG